MEAMLGNLTQEEMLTNQAGKNCINEQCELHLSLVKSLSTVLKQHQTTIHLTSTIHLSYLGGIVEYGPPPPMFNPSHPLLPKLDKEQIGWWDDCLIE